MTVTQLAAPLALNVITEGTEEDTWGQYINDNWSLIRQAIVDQLAVNGLKADLVGGVIPSNQLPAISISNTFQAANQAAMLALAAGAGDIAVRADDGHLYALAATPASTLGNWVQLNTGSGLTSINGETGPAVTGYVKLSTNSQTVTGTGFTFSNPVAVATAVSGGQAVNLTQMTAAISAVSGGTVTRQTFLIGNGSATVFNIDHNRGANVSITAVEVDTGNEIDVEVNHPPGNLNRAVVTAKTVYATNKLRITAVG